MKKIILFITTGVLVSCVEVKTEGVAHEAGDLIRDGVKGGYEVYKESKNKKDSTYDTAAFWDKTRYNLKEFKKTIKILKDS